MPSFEVLAPSYEPDLGAYVGISLEGIRTYPELITVIRQTDIDFTESPSNPIANPRRSKLPRAAFGDMYVLGFDYDRKKGRFARYNVLLDTDGNIVCIENNFGYGNPDLLIPFLLFRVAPIIAVGLLIIVTLNFFLSGG